MDRNLALVLIFGLAVLGPSVVFAFGNAESINTLGRDPDSASKVLTGLIARMIIVEALALAALLYAFAEFA